MFSSLLTSLAGILSLPILFAIANADNPLPASELLGSGWSPNVGWVSVNCSNSGQCGSSTYSVAVSSGNPNRILSGYAWSSNIGWISFNTSDLAGCPSGTCSARMNSSTGEVNGWARALASQDPQSGSWGGWIKLRGSSYGVLANGTKWTGYAWGGGAETGTGDYSPNVGGNAEVGWISFRGYTTEDEPKLYGINAATSTSADGPRSISCGASQQSVPKNSNVIWSVVVDSSKVSDPVVNYTYEWTLPGGHTANGTTTPIVLGSYNDTGLKQASVTVTINGVPYIVDCDAADISGKPSQWFPYVIVGGINLDSIENPDSPGGNLQAGVGDAQFGGSHTTVTCYNGSTVPSENCDYPLVQTFNNVIQVVMQEGNTPPSSDTSTGYFLATSPTVTSINPGEEVRVTASWPTIPSSVCPSNSPLSSCKAWMRVCADHTVSPSFSFDGVVCEYGESCPNVGNTVGMNCSPGWTSFQVQRAPPPPPTLGSCRASPGVAKVGKQITWTIDPASIQDGLPPFNYQWTSLTPGGDNQLSGSNTPTLNKTYATGGTKTAKVTVTDSLGRQLVVTCAGSARLQTLEEF